MKEEQIMTMAVDNGKLQAFGTGDSGTLYKIAGVEMENTIYWSQAYDTGTFSFPGTVYWQKEGNISLQFRTGNTSKPDKFWNDWGSQNSSESFKLNNKPGRYFQYRALWQEKTAVLKNVSIYYKPQNREPKIHSVNMNIIGENERKLLLAERPANIEISWK